MANNQSQVPCDTGKGKMNMPLTSFCGPHDDENFPAIVMYGT